jgi:hypothetical protein
MSSNFCLIAQLLQLRPDLLGAHLAWIDRYQHMLRGRTGLYLLDAGKAPKRIADTLLTTGTMHLAFTCHHELERLCHEMPLLSPMISRSLV